MIKKIFQKHKKFKILLTTIVLLIVINIVVIFTAPTIQGFKMAGLEIQSVSNQLNRKVLIVHFIGTELQDCASGCFRDSMVRVYDPLTFKFYEITHHIRVTNVLNRLAGISIDCGRTQNTKNSLHKKNGNFNWRVKFLPHDKDWKYGCELSGYIVYDMDNVYKNKIKTKYYNVDCEDKEQARKYLEMIKVYSDDVTKDCYSENAKYLKD
ncbi:MAG: hypothetical protein PF488_03675 [Patescibacteria group bacterium]|jgi:hypothetical protein|nr:hypothetical protein [Patescibacteria group bacterium]